LPSLSTAVLLCDECHAINTCGSVGGSLAPDVVGKCFLSGERGREGHGRVSESLETERTQPMPVISPNAANLKTHGVHGGSLTRGQSKADIDLRGAQQQCPASGTLRLCPGRSESSAIGD